MTNGPQVAAGLNVYVSRDSESARLRISYCAFAAGLLGVLVFLPSIGNGFAYDDVAIVLGDLRVRSLGSMLEIFTSGYWHEEGQGLYRPLSTLSFAIDWSLAGESAAWFHFMNVLWHGFATSLLVVLLGRLLPPAAALVGGLVFAVHPVHVEAVANVVGRAEVLAALFALAACLVWTADVRLPAWRALRPLGVGVLFAFAALSKESALVLPALFLLLDVVRGLTSRNISEYTRHNGVAFAVIAIVIAGYLAVRVAAIGGIAPVRLDATLEVSSTFGLRLLTALQAWPEYVRLLFFPRTLLADYGPGILRPAVGLNGRVVAGAVLLVVCVLGGLLALKRAHRLTGFALLWFAVTILPVSNLIVPIGVLVAERTLYLPSVALAIAVAAGAMPLLPGRAPLVRRWPLLAAMLVVLLAARTAQRVPEWKSTDRIMGAMLRDRPNSFRAHWYYARLARLNGDTAVALQRYNEALRLWPYRQRLTMEAATFAVTSGSLPFALRVASFAANRWPDDVIAHRLNAGVALDLGDTVSARAAVQAGLRYHPDDQLLRRMNAVIPAHSR